MIPVRVRNQAGAAEGYMVATKWAPLSMDDGGGRVVGIVVWDGGGITTEDLTHLAALPTPLRPSGMRTIASNGR